MPKTHFTRPPYEGRAACQWKDTQKLKLTTEISEVDCRVCLSAIIPAEHRTFTLEELRDRAIKYNS